MFSNLFLTFAVSLLFNSNFYGLLDTYKVCIDTVSAGCTHDGRNYLLTASAYYTDEQQYLEACTGQDIYFSFFL